MVPRVKFPQTCRGHGFFGARPARQPGRRSQQGIHLVVANVEPLKALVPLLELPGAPHLEPDLQIDALEFGKYVLQRRNNRLHRSPLHCQVRYGTPYAARVYAASF